MNQKTSASRPDCQRIVARMDGRGQNLDQKPRPRFGVAGLLSALLVALLTTTTTGEQLFGDANCDGVIDSADEPELIFRLFTDEPPPDDCFGADANDDGLLGASDLTMLQILLTPSPRTGPEITFLGIATSAGLPTPPLGELQPGLPVFFRVAGVGFKLVIEGTPGSSGSALSFDVFDSDPEDPSRRPDLQIQCDRALGGGSPEVCDDDGAPAIDPPDFRLTQEISDAMNDLACHFLTTPSSDGSCTQNEFGITEFVDARSRGQYCLQVAVDLRFPDGDTVCTVQLRDRGGNLGAPARLVVRVGGSASTFTPTPRPTPTRTATLTWSPSVTMTATRTFTQNATATRTRTNTPFLSPTWTATGSPAATPTPTVTSSRTRSATRTATPTVTFSPTPTGTATDTFTPTQTGTSTATPSATDSPTPTMARGPIVSFFGMAAANDRLLEPVAIENGVPVYERFMGQQFRIVVEGAIGPSNRAVGNSSFSPDPELRPDLQILPSQLLGDGSSAVCDRVEPEIGGVPAVDPLGFDDAQATTDVMNDLGCRFLNGSGMPIGRRQDESCVLFDTGEDFVDERTQIQFCALFDRIIQPPLGDTTFLVRLRDLDGNLGEPAQMIVRITE